MIRSILIIIVLLFGSSLMSIFYIGYSRAGAQYISKIKEKRKSIRPGSVSYYGSYGSRGYRGGGK